MQIHVSRDGQQFGPYTLDEVKQYLAAGNLKPTDRAWYDGAPDWMSITQVPGVAVPVFAAAHSRMEAMALGAVGVGALALVTGGVTYWGGMILMIITIVLGVAGLVLAIIGLVRIKNGRGDRRGKGLAIAGAVISPLAIVLGVFINPGGGNRGSSDPAMVDGQGGSGISASRLRANRIKCVSNVKQVVSALNAFADDNKNRYPWLLTWKDQVAEQGGAAGASATAFYDTSTLFAQAGVKSGFGGSQKILVSPCDPDRKEANAKVDLATASLDTPIPNNAHSYGVVTGGGFTDGPPQRFSFPSDKGADVLKPTTTLIVTRNISVDALSDAATGNPRTATVGAASQWLGADDDAGSSNPRIMAYLKTNMGQAGSADGSGSQSDNADLSNRARAHNNARGGNYLGCPSPILDTPND